MIEYNFSKLFNALRAKGLEPIDIMEKVGLDRATYFRLAKARNMNDYNATVKLLDKICSKLGVHLNKVLKYKK